ncbi:hypothetical protein K9M42_02655 [Patescibacteria group bacterium]|nr:hypothetical protein [Patescibacteria group bacterium]
MNKTDILKLFKDYAKKVKFIHKEREYEMMVIDEIFFEEIAEKISKKGE